MGPGGIAEVPAFFRGSAAVAAGGATGEASDDGDGAGEARGGRGLDETEGSSAAIIAAVTSTAPVAVRW